MCTDCPKLYPITPAPAPPAASPAPGKKKRRATPVTTEQILQERSERRRRNREAAKRAGTLVEDGVRIRGRWVSTGKQNMSLRFLLLIRYDSYQEAAVSDCRVIV